MALALSNDCEIRPAYFPVFSSINSNYSASLSETVIAAKISNFPFFYPIHCKIHAQVCSISFYWKLLTFVLLTTQI